MMFPHDGSLSRRKSGNEKCPKSESFRRERGKNVKPCDLQCLTRLSLCLSLHGQRLCSRRSECRNRDPQKKATLNLVKHKKRRASSEGASSGKKGVIFRLLAAFCLSKFDPPEGAFARALCECQLFGNKEHLSDFHQLKVLLQIESS